MANREVDRSWQNSVTWDQEKSDVIITITQ